MTKSLLLFLIFSTSSSFAFLMIATEGRLDECTYKEEFVFCALISTTSTPTLAIVDTAEIANDDALLQLADEVSGEVPSQEMINQYAVYFQVTTGQVIEAVESLQNSNLGLSFENLNSALK